MIVNHLVSFRIHEGGRENRVFKGFTAEALQTILTKGELKKGGMS